ncbi:TolC family protein [Spirosoma taeanense]|uniref:TolC family protein n=1 Tax=Spirosoma taeanense TaxID=2735870 RepID=A0A6M5YDI7_9BACT|nr:TolC family protein [Spirosoma taeanense]QJW92075.1 TolC family protein [Spirosoma taeanense]
MKKIITYHPLLVVALLLTANPTNRVWAQVQAAPAGQQPATPVSPAQQPAGLQPVNPPATTVPPVPVPTPSQADLSPIGTTPAGEVGRPANAPLVAGQGFTMQEAINFAVRQNVNVRNSQLDALSAEARIKEVKSSALPQVSLNGSFTDNLIIQRAFLPANFFDPNASPDAPAVPVQFGVKFAGNASAAVNQLIYSASLNVGLRAAATYRELAQRTTEATKVTVAEQVAKAYYGVLVAQERAKLLDLNIGRLDTLLRETRALNQQGFVEKIDVDRLEVQVNNLRTEHQNVQNLVQLSYTLLKFQMGLGVNDEITLTEQPLQERNLNELEQMITPDPTFRYTSRIEYSTLETQIKLAQLDIESTQKGYYPTLAAFANYGYNSGRNQLSQLVTSPWLNFATAGISLQVPIFDGFLKRYQIEQKRITLQKAQNSGELLRNSIDLQIRQANITLTNSLQTLRTQQRNRNLASEIVRVTRIKYKEGVGSNIEVLNAESSFREAQTNYFAALYDFLITKVDQDKAIGKLYTGN